MDIYESERLKFIPIGEVEHEDFLYGLLKEPPQVSSVIKIMASRKLMSMYIVPREGPNYKDATPIGFISLSKPEERQIQHGNTYLTLAISKDAQGKGYGTEAIAWALDWAFDFARMHRVEIFCYSWNAGAKRLYTRVGFREEGVKREAVWFMGGWHDMHEMAMLEHEWRDVWRGKVNAKTWAPEDGQNYSSEQIAQKMGSA
ncbi:hypothetical protein CIB48_g11115 [Xylaria polymorpha]|nr:hypothetical protein CIB48_g11115 [Xylaria polymorpha]